MYQDGYQKRIPYPSAAVYVTDPVDAFKNSGTEALSTQYRPRRADRVYPWICRVRRSELPRLDAARRNAEARFALNALGDCDDKFQVDMGCSRGTRAVRGRRAEPGSIAE